MPSLHETRVDYSRKKTLTPPGRDLAPEAVEDAVSAGAEGPDDEALDPAPEPADPVESLRQLVGVVVHRPRRRQVGRAEAAQQQRQEQVQHLK